jgi:hypothetical protein
MTRKIVFMRNQNRFSEIFPKYHMDILLGNFKAKLGTEYILKSTTENESLHQDSYDNSVRHLHYIIKSTC